MSENQTQLGEPDNLQQSVVKAFKRVELLLPQLHNDPHSKLDAINLASILMEKSRYTLGSVLGNASTDWNTLNQQLPITDERSFRRFVNIAANHPERLRIDNCRRAVGLIVDCIQKYCDNIEFQTTHQVDQRFHEMIADIAKIFDRLNNIPEDKIPDGALSIHDFISYDPKEKQSFYFWYDDHLRPFVIRNHLSDDPNDMIYISAFFARLKTSDSAIVKSFLQESSYKQLPDIKGTRFLGKSIDDALKLYALMRHEFMLGYEIDSEKNTLINPDFDHSDYRISDFSNSIPQEKYNQIIDENDIFNHRRENIKKTETFIYNTHDKYDDLRANFLNDMRVFTKRRREIFELKGLLSALDVEYTSPADYHELYKEIHLLEEQDRSHIEAIQKKYYFLDSVPNPQIFTQDDANIRLNTAELTPFACNILDPLVCPKQGINFEKTKNPLSGGLYLGISRRFHFNGIPVEFSFSTDLFEFLNETISPHFKYKEKTHAKLQNILLNKVGEKNL